MPPRLVSDGDRGALIGDLLTGALTASLLTTVKMAPLDFGDRINLGSLVGTWVGSLFTAVGLLAVISQFRAVLGKILSTKETMLRRAAGEWHCCLNDRALPDEGIAEEAAPAVAGWIQAYYLENRSTVLTQSDRRIAGTSSWSKFFSQVGITPAELNGYGGPNAQILPVGSKVKRSPPQSDILVSQGKFYYGFTCREFAALMIISGFPPTDFGDRGNFSSPKFLGVLHVADQGAFSQQALFDPHGGTKIMEVEKERLIHRVPVRGCIHVALGVLETRRGSANRKWIVLPDHIHSTNDSSASHEKEPFKPWRTYPRATQLNSIRYNIEQLASVSGGDFITYTAESMASEPSEKVLMQSFLGSHYPCHSLNWRAALLSAYAIDALEPWALLPVAPRHFVSAFTEILEPFVGSRDETIGYLCERLVSSRTKAPSGWEDFNEQATAVSKIGDVKTEFFCGSANYCAYYYDAMVVIFNDSRIPMSDVRKYLAAVVSWYVLFPDEKLLRYEEKEDELKIKFKEGYLSAMLGHLHGDVIAPSPPRSLPGEWAIKLYATYLWGWLHERCLADDLFLRFQRRVFLG
ncbi:hypothetical protein PRK78_005998 [Emydomyces testavorans]|uniref:Uncharacterized protein n=1 Tax=Emydomyces testavorans TaxID=2070801 RepID=A0AAF0DKK9_9EURO|nr:hypothetical protein PRK78_005998 [Emydomyces testavorans]